MDRDKISNLRRGPAIDTSHQVSVHLAKQFQMRRILKSANQKQESPVAAMFVNGSGRNRVHSVTQVTQKVYKLLFHYLLSSFLISLGIRRPLTFHILIFSSETP
jgi:hypothetical protein